MKANTCSFKCHSSNTNYRTAVGTGIDKTHMNTTFHLEQINSDTDSYTIRELLSSNEHSRIYLCSPASDPSIFRILKLFNVATSSEDELRIAHEIQAICSISHPNVISGLESITCDQRLGLLMEYAEGGSLSARLDKERRLDFSEAIQIAAQLCEGLEAIHGAGFVHRGLQPSNILFAADGTVKITDFGSVKDPAGERLTQGNSILGSVEYASPEYIEFGMLDRRSDVYALGALLFKMISGRSLFPADTVVESIVQRLTSEPVPVHTLVEDCPLELSTIISCALKRNPFGRYESPRAMFEDLAQFQAPAVTTHSVLPDIWNHRVGLLAESFQTPLDAETNHERVYLTPLERLSDKIISACTLVPKIAISTLPSVLELRHAPQVKVLGKKSAELYTALRATTATAIARLQVDKTTMPKSQTRAMATNLTKSSPPMRLRTTSTSSQVVFATGMAALVIFGVCNFVRLNQKAIPEASAESTATAIKPENSISNQTQHAADRTNNPIAEEAQTAATSPLTYRIQPGDTLSKIGTRFNISSKVLEETNGISNPHQLKVGKILTIPSI